MGGELMVDLLPSGKMDVCQIHTYSKYFQRTSHQFSIFFLAYTQYDFKIEIFMEFPIGFVVVGGHPRKWVIGLDLKTI